MVQTNAHFFVDMEFVESQWCIYYAVLVAVWGTLIVEKWKRKQAELSFKWDMADFEKEETIRDDFYGDEAVSSITGEVEKFYPINYKRDLHQDLLIIMNKMGVIVLIYKT